MGRKKGYIPEELALADEVFYLLEKQDSSAAGRSLRYLRKFYERLKQLRETLNGYPSLLKPHQVAGERRDAQSLVDAICSCDLYTVEAVVPTRATVGRAYQVARYNFLNLLVKTVRFHFPLQGERLAEEIKICMLQAVTNIIAEDVLTAIAGDASLEQTVRSRAVYLLLDLWENRANRPLRDFFPVFRSVWEAKCRFSISYGTLAGTSEMLEMMRQGCHRDAIEYFTSENLTQEEVQALLELFFNATHEELAKMYAWMAENRQQLLAAEDVARIFDVPLSRLHRTITKPKDMFFTFRERQANAYARRLYGLPGPKRTAEEYLMIYLLRTSEIPTPFKSRRRK